jgi:hypothetical protein
MTRRGFTTLELAVVMCLIALGYFAVWHVTRVGPERARTSSCSSNLKQLALAAHGYAADYDRLPQPSQGMIALMPYVKNQQIFVDPAAPRREYTEGRSDYLLNTALRPDDRPTEILVADNVRDRHQGRWIGVRLDAACFVWPAAAWDDKMKWVNSDGQTSR